MSDELLFRWILGGVLTGAVTIITGLLAFILTGFRSDIRNVQAGLEDLKTEVHKNYVELSSAISTIGGKLDQLNKFRR